MHATRRTLLQKAALAAGAAAMPFVGRAAAAPVIHDGRLGPASRTDIAAPGETAAPAPVHAVTYFEGPPAAARRAGLALRRFVEACRREPGHVACVALRETGHPGRFAMLEAWRDPAALEARAPATGALAAELAPALAAPLDRRPSSALLTAPPPAEAGAGDAAVYVLTHVDVVPPAKDQAIALLTELVRNSRAEPGAWRIDVLQQDSRPNHFTLVEVWHDRGARDTHLMAAHTRAFRQSLAPLQGALYDERLYARVR